MARLSIIKIDGTSYTIGADVLVTINSGKTAGTPISISNGAAVTFSNGKPVAATQVDGGT